MPIDPNIALGVRPVEMPNMLGQMGQMMQLRQAQQGFEEQNALRNAFSQGVDINDPATFKRIAGINPKLAMELRGKDVETQGKQTELGLKRTEYLGAAYGGLVKNPTIENAYSIFDNAVAMGILPRQAAEGLRAKIAATGGDPRQIAALAQAGVDGAIDAKAKMQDATSRRNADVTSGPGYGQLALAQAKEKREIAQQAEIDALFGKPSSAAPAAAPVGGGGGGVPNALPAVVGAAPAARAPTNMLVPGAQAPAAPVAAAQPSDIYAEIRALDAKIAPLVNTGNPRASAIVQQLIAQRNALMQSAKQMYGGQETTMATTDPKTGLPIVVKARPNEYGVLVPIEMAPIPLSTDASGTGSTGISSTVARPAPSAPVWNEKTGVWMTPPTPENPKGTAVENPEIKNIVQTRAANATLKVAGYNPKTGTDEVSSLIKKSTSGLGENWANKVWSAISGTGSEGAEAIAKLETRANEMTLALAPNGSLGAGFSNEDRTFMLGKLGDVANPNKPMNVRLAAWEDVMERTARNAGVPYTKQSYGGSSSNKPAAPSTALPKGFKLD
jgi:hypothetical protein